MANDSLIQKLKMASGTAKSFVFTGDGDEVVVPLDIATAAMGGLAERLGAVDELPTQNEGSTPSPSTNPCKISVNNDWQKIDDVLHEASRLIDYFANGKTLFVGSGTPVGCLERINHALNLVAAMRKPEPVSVSLNECISEFENGVGTRDGVRKLLEALGISYVD